MATATSLLRCMWYGGSLPRKPSAACNCWPGHTGSNAQQALAAVLATSAVRRLPQPLAQAASPRSPDTLLTRRNGWLPPPTHVPPHTLPSAPPCADQDSCTWIVDDKRGRVVSSPCPPLPPLLALPKPQQFCGMHGSALRTPCSANPIMPRLERVASLPAEPCFCPAALYVAEPHHRLQPARQRLPHPRPCTE